MKNGVPKGAASAITARHGREMRISRPRQAAPSRDDLIEPSTHLLALRGAWGALLTAGVGGALLLKCQARSIEELMADYHPTRRRSANVTQHW